MSKENLNKEDLIPVSENTIKIDIKTYEKNNETKITKDEENLNSNKDYPFKKEIFIENLIIKKNETKDKFDIKSIIYKDDNNSSFILIKEMRIISIIFQIYYHKI